MITDYLRDDVWFNSEYADQQTTGTNSTAVSDAIKALKGDDEEATPWKGASEARLNELFKAGKIDEATYRAEMKAKNKGPAAIDDLVEQNRPDPNAPKPSQIKPPTMAGGAGLQDYSNLSETDIINKVKKGEWTPEQGQNALIASKGYSEGSARETIGAVKAEIAKSAPTAASRALEARGITSKLSESEILKGAEQGLWTPDEAYKALIELKGYSATEAATTLRLRGGKGGPGGGVDQKLPPARSAGELMSRSNVASGPGDLMARAAAPKPAASGMFQLPVEERKAAVTDTPSPLATRVQSPTVLGYAPTAASGKSVSPTSSAKATSAVPASVLATAKRIAASGKSPPPYTPGQPYPPPGWDKSSAGLASVMS